MEHLQEAELKDLIEISRRIRRHILLMTHSAGSGHPGGSLSAVEILTALYFYIMRVDPQNPHWADRDRFILSKGHACPVHYAALAERGFFPVEELLTLRKMDSRLQGHPDMKKTPGLDITGGSLGQGLSVGLGMALGARVDKKDYNVYVLLGDGELQEGQVWESVMAASHYRVDNLFAFVDRNGLQVDGFTKDILNVEPISEKWQSFGWHVQEIDGHDISSILNSIEIAKSISGLPSVIVANTIKGKGVSFMENQVDWHGQAPNDEQLKKALEEIG